MKILAFDTSLATCTVIAVASDRVLAERSEQRERGHAEALMPMIEEVRGEAGLEYGEFDLVAATVGPGSFTGIRVAVAAARGIALATGVRTIGVTTTAALAQRASSEAREPAPILAILDARRGEAYAQLFNLEGERLVTRWPLPILDRLENIAGALDGEAGLVVGSGADGLKKLLPASRRWRDVGFREPSGLAIARVARETLRQDQSAPLPIPLYMRPPDTNRAPKRR